MFSSNPEIILKCYAEHEKFIKYREMDMIDKLNQDFPDSNLYEKNQFLSLIPAIKQDLILLQRLSQKGDKNAGTLLATIVKNGNCYSYNVFLKQMKELSLEQLMGNDHSKTTYMPSTLKWFQEYVMRSSQSVQQERNPSPRP